jgi:O-antigen ligase
LVSAHFFRVVLFYAQLKNDAAGVAPGIIGVKKRIFLVGFLLAAALGGITLSIPATRERVLHEFTTDFGVLEQNHFTYATRFTGLSLRLLIWKHCLAALDERNAWWWGIGSGDVQHLLDERYKKVGMYTGNPAFGDRGYLGYGPHSQFVELLLATGIFSLLLFLGIVGLQFHRCLAERNYLLLQLLLIFVFFCISESVLGSNKGIVFYCFFSLLLLYQSRFFKDI